MSTTAITMEELESERAELLPSRETLCARCGCKTAYGCAAPASPRSGRATRTAPTTTRSASLNVQADNNNVNILGLQSVL